MITREDILNEIESIYNNKLMIQTNKPLTFDTDFSEDALELDSIMSLELIVELEIKYDIEVDEDELKNGSYVTVGNLVDLIYNKIAEKYLVLNEAK